MPPDTLENFAAALTNPLLFGIGIELAEHRTYGTRTLRKCIIGALTNGSLFNNPQVIRHVPAVGPNLIGYEISKITQTLNSLDIIQQSPTRFRLDAVSTLHIYGGAIPEPSTLVLTAFAHCALRVRQPRC